MPQRNIATNQLNFLPGTTFRLHSRQYFGVDIFSTEKGCDARNIQESIDRQQRDLTAMVTAVDDSRYWQLDKKQRERTTFLCGSQTPQFVRLAPATFCTARLPAE